MFLMTVKADTVCTRKTWGKCLKRAGRVIGLLGIIMFFSGNGGAWAITAGNFDNPETLIRMLVNWHESMRELIKPLAVEREVMSTEVEVNPVEVDLAGEWEIQEEDKAYQATLDAMGNGLYNWQEGRIQTEKVADRLWSGTWHQKGNDREGAFEVLLSEDGKTAEGVWWYSRVGTQKDIPPREWGGSYKFKRLSPQPHAVVTP